MFRQCYVHGLDRFRHKHCWRCPKISKNIAPNKVGNPVVFTLTNVKTQAWTVVTGLHAFSPKTPPPSTLKSWCDGHIHSMWMWCDIYCRKYGYYDVYLWHLQMSMYMWFAETWTAIILLCQLGCSWSFISRHCPSYFSTLLDCLTKEKMVQ